jgi:exodeoxyribonuclease V alpha subunit
VFFLEEQFHAEGAVTRYIYQSDDFHVALFVYDSDQVIIAGNLYGLSINEKITVHGEWTVHSKYGRQIKVSYWERPVPTTEEQVIAFLSSGLVKGVGPVTAQKIVKELGPEAIDTILESGPVVIQGIKGLKKKAQQIYESLQETLEIQNIMKQLLPLGLTPKTAHKAYKKFGRAAVEIIKNNPYCLIELERIGFSRADEMAKKLGVPMDSPQRIEAAVNYVLDQAISQGHCYLPMVELVELSSHLLNQEEEHVQPHQVTEAAKRMVTNGALVLDNDAVFLKKLYRAEIAVAEKIKMLLRSQNGTRVPESKIEKWIKEYELANGIRLAPEQKQAVVEMMSSDFMVITGNPGVGKTTVVKAILNIYQRSNPSAKVLLAAPTGRASRRMSELTGMDACTIHKMMGFTPDSSAPRYNSQNPLPCDLLVVDEVSMLDIHLARHLFDAIGEETKVLLVGDKDQLPSVGPGNVLNDLLAAEVPCVKLTKIFRQAAESQIILGAHCINNGKVFTPDHSRDDFYFIKKEEPEDIAQMVKRCVVRLLKTGFSIDDIQVLSPMKKGVIGTVELNKSLQEIINPSGYGKPEIRRGNTIFRVGDRVLCTKNDYDKNVFNGETGVIEQIIDEEGAVELKIKFNGSGSVEYARDELDEIDLAYAMTIHKMQGSEAKVVIIPVSTSHYIMLARNLLYTGVTRARERVVLIGTKKAYHIAVKNDKITRRNTKLAERLKSQESTLMGAEQILT